jgi:hypothetical protein
MERQGLTQTAIDARLAADHCVQRVDGGGTGLRPMGEPAREITVGRPAIYKIQKPKKSKGKATTYYIATASWRWNYVPSNVKGYDAFSLRFTKKISEQSHSLTYSGNGRFYGSKTINQAERAGSGGVGFIFNEGPRTHIPMPLDMQGHTGRMTVSFRPSKPGCWYVQAYAQYAHSWASNSVTGISLSAGRDNAGFGINWQENKHHWRQTSQPSAEFKVCR